MTSTAWRRPSARVQQQEHEDADQRLAVLKDHRGRATLTLIRHAVRIARRKGYRRILGHAQPRLVAFWARYFNGRPRPGRDRFSFSDHPYTEVVAEFDPSTDALTLDSDPLLLLRPEGDWDRPGVLERSAGRTRAVPAD